MVRMTTLPAAHARRVQTYGPVAVAAAAAAPINQVRRVNRAPDLQPAPRAGLPPCSSLRSVILSSLRLMMLRPAAGRAGAGCLPRRQLAARAARMHSASRLQPHSRGTGPGLAHGLAECVRC